MSIVKSLKVEAGYPHRIHRPKKRRIPLLRYRKLTRRVLAQKIARIEKLESRHVQEV